MILIMTEAGHGMTINQYARNKCRKKLNVIYYIQNIWIKEI